MDTQMVSEVLNPWKKQPAKHYSPKFIIQEMQVLFPAGQSP